jgi:hypothetical protein
MVALEAYVIPAYAELMANPRAYADSFKERAGGKELDDRETMSEGVNCQGLMSQTTCELTHRTSFAFTLKDESAAYPT